MQNKKANTECRKMTRTTNEMFCLFYSILFGHISDIIKLQRRRETKRNEMEKKTISNSRLLLF